MIGNSWSRLLELTRRALPSLKVQEWVFFAIPVALALSALLTIGPIIQPYIFSIGDSRAPSIYEAAHESGIVQFPDVGGWLLFGLEPLFLLMSSVVVIVALRKNRVRDFSVAGALGSFVVLTVTDFLFDGFSGNTNLADYLTNIAANAMGGAFLFFVFAGWAFARQLFAPSAAGRWQTPLVVLLTSISLSVIAFVLVTSVYQPTTVRFESELAAPADGFFLSAVSEKLVSSSPGKSLSADEGGAKRHFSLFPSQAELGGIRLTSADGMPSFQLKEQAGAPVYDVELALFRNCFMGRDEGNTLAAPQLVRFESITAFGLTIDDGVSEMVVRENTNVAIQRERPTFYWMRNSEQEGDRKVELSEYVNREDRIFFNPGGDFVVLISPFLWRGEPGNSVQSARTLKLRVNQREHTLTLVPSSRGGKGRLSSCAPTGQVGLRAALAAGSGGNIPLADDVVGASLLVRLRRRGTSVSDLRSGSIEMSGVSGWIRAERPDIRPERVPALGEARSVSMSGNIRRVKVDGASIDVPIGENVTIIGEISGRMTAEGNVSLLGRGDAVWVGPNRMNPTRWERMASELQVLILTFIGIMAAAAVRLYRPIWTHIKLNEQLRPF